MRHDCLRYEPNRLYSDRCMRLVSTTLFPETKQEDVPLWDQESSCFFRLYIYRTERASNTRCQHVPIVVVCNIFTFTSNLFFLLYCLNFPSETCGQIILLTLYATHRWTKNVFYHLISKRERILKLTPECFLERVLRSVFKLYVELRNKYLWNPMYIIYLYKG